MKLEIGFAGVKDAAEWARLRYLLWPDCPLDRHRLEIDQLQSGDGIVALAKVEGSTVGFAEVSIRGDHVEGTSVTPVPYLEGWFVTEEFRGKGVGRSLLNFVEDWARRNGYPELASDAEIENGASIRLHGLLGFREVGRTVHFVKDLTKNTHRD